MEIYMRRKYIHGWIVHMSNKIALLPTIIQLFSIELMKFLLNKNDHLISKVI